ncbi:hypothetical protein [Halobellus salinisoli]|uniref:hypothetical protein n=1 Tax=Halobellus salinisoli TaxID=3108500 RepID=UPI00300A3DF7
MRKRIFAIFAAFLVVSSGIAAPAAATTEQEAGEAACGGLDYLLGVTFANTLTGSDYSVCQSPNDEIEEMKESDGNQTKLDIYESVVAQQENSDHYITSTNNHLEDSESVAWMKMQVAVAEAYKNGSSESVARVKAKEAIDDYYSVRQENLVRQWNTHLANIEYLHETAENESAVPNDFIRNYYPGDDRVYLPDFYNNSVTTLDGTEVNATEFRLEYPDETTKGAWVPTGASGITQGDFGDPYTEFDMVLWVEPPTESYEHKEAFAPWDYIGAWNEIETNSESLRDESETFVNATYSDFESGEINASDVISANTAMFEYGTEYDSNDSLYNTVGALSLMGFDTPNMSSSGTMDVAYNGSSYTGIVLAHEAPNGSWNTNTTYDSANIEGPVFMATVEGKKIDFAEGENFTIEQMRNRDGQNTTTVDTTKYVYKTSNTSELLEMQQQLTDLRAEIEAREPDGGGGSDGSGLGQNTIIAVAALAGAALLLGRGNQ